MGIFCPPLLEIGSSWARYFCSGISTCDDIVMIFLTRDWFTFDRHWCQSGFILVLAKSLSIQKFILGNVCLKAVVKVMCSESSEASFSSASKDFQSCDDIVEPIATEEEVSEDMFPSQIAGETDLPDWYFIWFLRFDSFCFYQCVYFCKKS